MEHKTKLFATRMKFIEAIDNNCSFYSNYREPEIYYDGPFKPISQILEEGMLEKTGIDYWLPGEVGKKKVYVRYFDFEERDT